MGKAPYAWSTILALCSILLAGGGAGAQTAVDGRLKMLQQTFVDNVHAPAGMAVLAKATRKFPAGSLFVCTGATSGCDDKNERITDVKKFNPGVTVFDPESGKLIGFIALPERAANVCFGGRYRNRLFMAACHSIYSLYVNTQGAPGG